MAIDDFLWGYAAGALVTVIAFSLFLPLRKATQDGSTASAPWRIIALSVFSLILVGGGYALLRTPPPGASSAIDKHAMQAMLDDLPPALLDSIADVQTKPYDPDAWHKMGAMLRKAGRLDEAVSALEQAVTLSPDDTEIVLSYAQTSILAANGQISPAARAALEKVRTATPDKPELAFFLGLMAQQDGNIVQAKQHWQRAQETLPNDSPFYMMSSRYLTQLDEAQAPGTDSSGAD